MKGTTVKGYESTLKQLCIFTGDIDVGDISLEHIMEWFRRMENLGYAENTSIPKIMALRKFFEFCQRMGWNVVSLDLMRIPRKSFENPPRVATKEEYEKLLTAIPCLTNDPRHIRNLAIVNLLWDTGARNGEIISLNASDMDLDRRRAVIRTEKNRGSRPFREIFWSESTNENIKRWIQKREHLKLKKEFIDPDALFIGIAFNNGKRLRNAGVGEMLRRYSHKADINPILNAHSFRHHKGHSIIQQGGSSADVMNLLGHATVQSTTVYTMMHDQELAERSAKFMKADEIPVGIHTLKNQEEKIEIAKPATPMPRPENQGIIFGKIDEIKQPAVDEFELKNLIDRVAAEAVQKAVAQVMKS